MLNREELAGRFTVWDYAVFAGMLAFSAAIGIYHAFSGGRQRTTSEFLMANRSMGIFPVSLSLLASFMSAITLLGTPAEVYNYSTIYWLIGIGYCMTIPMAAFLYLPIFYKIQLTSVFEYLELRFQPFIRKCGSIVYILQMTMYMAIVLYAPALALSQVTGIHVWGSVVALATVCTFYTTVGGMKAVMWTDAFQVFIMFGSILTAIIHGCVILGGPSYVWQRNVEGHRINFNDFNPDPTVRHSFWALTFGGCYTWLAVYGVNQAQVQRYLTASTMRQAQLALLWNIPGLMLLLSICMCGGLVIYATYADCDPQKSGLIDTSDQIFPLLVMDTLGYLPGLPGLFVAGIFSGALSTVSSGMNSLAAVTLEDFVRPCCGKNFTDKKAALVSKLLAVAYGGVSLGLVAVAAELGSVLQAALSIFGIMGGPLLGVFTLGMFVPFANSWGAGIGMCVSFVIILWIGVGAQVYKSHIPLHTSPVSIDGCQNISGSIISAMNGTFESSLLDVNSTSRPTFLSEGSFLNSTMTPSADTVPFLELYKISYLWYSAIACATVVVVGIVVSLVTGGQDPTKLPRGVLSPLVERFCCCLPKKFRRKSRDITEVEISDSSNLQKNGKVMTERQNGMDNSAYESKENGNGVHVLSYNSLGEYTTTL